MDFKPRPPRAVPVACQKTWTGEAYPANSHLGSLGEQAQGGGRVNGARRARYHFIPVINGMPKNAISTQITLIGMPMRMKSLNLYPPGP